MVTLRRADPAPADPAATDAPPGGDAFAAIIADAEGVEGRAPDAAPADAGPPPPDHAAEAGQAVELVASLALPFVAHRWGKEIADLYGPAQRKRIAEALALVAQKRGWTLASILDGWGPELALCAALAGPVLPHLIAHAGKPASEPAPAPAPLPERTPMGEPVTPADDGRILA